MLVAVTAAATLPAPAGLVVVPSTALTAAVIVASAFLVLPRGVVSSASFVLAAVVVGAAVGNVPRR